MIEAHITSQLAVRKYPAGGYNCLVLLVTNLFCMGEHETFLVMIIEIFGV